MTNLLGASAGPTAGLIVKDLLACTETQVSVPELAMSTLALFPVSVTVMVPVQVCALASNVTEHCGVLPVVQIEPDPVAVMESLLLPHDALGV